MKLNELSAAQLRRAADIKDQITKLEGAFEDVMNGYIPVHTSELGGGFYPKGGKLYSDKHFTKELPNPLQLPLPKRRRKMSAEAKAKISTAAKKRWRKAHAAGHNHL